MKAKRTLVFRYQHDNFINDGEELKRVLRENGVNGICYHEGTYYLFKVQKPQSMTWNDLMRLINSVHAPFYRFENTIIENGNEYVIVG